MRNLLYALCFAAFALPHLAHADTIVDFNYHATFEGGGVEQGIIGIDMTTGRFSRYDIFVTTNSIIPSDQTLYYQGDIGGSPGGNAVLFLALDNNYDAGSILLPAGTLFGYAGGPICSEANPCNGFLSTFFIQNALTGSLTPVIAAATPEPSTVTLLATGLLSALGLARRKLRP